MLQVLVGFIVGDMCEGEPFGWSGWHIFASVRGPSAIWEYKGYVCGRWSNPILYCVLPGTRLNQHGIPDLKRKGKEVIKKKRSHPPRSTVYSRSRL